MLGLMEKLSPFQSKATEDNLLMLDKKIYAPLFIFYLFAAFSLSRYVELCTVLQLLAIAFKHIINCKHFAGHRMMTMLLMITNLLFQVDSVCIIFKI